MFDVYYFLATMKINWLRRINVVESGFKTFMLNIYPDLSNLTVCGSEYINILSQRIKNPFWKDVLKHLKNLYTRSTPQSVDEFLSELVGLAVIFSWHLRFETYYHI